MSVGLLVVHAEILRVRKLFDGMGLVAVWWQKIRKTGLGVGELLVEVGGWDYVGMRQLLWLDVVGLVGRNRGSRGGYGSAEEKERFGVDSWRLFRKGMFGFDT